MPVISTYAQPDGNYHRCSTCKTSKSVLSRVIHSILNYIGQAKKRWRNDDKPGDPGNSYQRVIIASAIVNVKRQIRGGTVCMIK